MTRIGKLHVQALAGPRLSFAEFQRLLGAFGFELDRIAGSHHIYRHDAVPRRLPVQPDGKDAKRYQVDQFIGYVRLYDLTLTEE